MNERIDELMIQAGARFEFLHGVHYDDFQYRKFAELIVNKHLSIWEQMDNGNAVAGYVEMEDYPKAILKYFGVEE